MNSDIAKKGSTRAAHRSLFYAMGYTPEDLDKPLIGVVNAFNEIIPGHFHLRESLKALNSASRRPAAPRWNFRPSASATASPWAMTA